MIKFFLILYLFFQVQEAIAQHIARENNTNVSLPDKFIKDFQPELNEAISLYNGKEHIPYDAGNLGSPYYQGGILDNSTIMYDGVLYKNVNLMYDMVASKVILEYPNKIIKIELLNDLIDYFIFQEHHFVKLSDTINNLVDKRNFYELLHNGTTRFYLLHTSVINEKINDLDLTKEYILSKTYIIHKNDKYYKIKRPADIYKIVNVDKEEMRQILKEKNISIKKNKEQAFLEIIKHHDLLSKNDK